MTTQSYSAFLLAAVIGTAACHDDPVGPSARYDLVIETDKTSYSLTADSMVRVVMTNQSNRSVYLSLDSLVVYERFREGEWRDPVDWSLFDGSGLIVPMSPGNTTSDELNLRFYFTPGTYRFRYLVYADPDLRTLLPVDERVSPSFEVIQ